MTTMMWKMKAMWRILTSKGFWIVTKHSGNELLRLGHELTIGDVECIIGDASVIREDALRQEAAVDEANNILNKIG